jgi:hypothetical protein
MSRLSLLLVLAFLMAILPVELSADELKEVELEVRGMT